jgi:general secretion pathway protein I
MVTAVGSAPAAHREAPTEAGFTLLEVLVALAILGVAVVTLIQLSSQSLRLVKTSGDYQQAVLLADRIAIQAQPTDEGVDTGEEGPYQWERRVSLVPMPDELEPKETIPGREPPKLFAVTIDVRWGQNQMLELATLRTPTTAPAAPGSLTSPGTGFQQPVNPATGQPISPGMQGPGRPFPTGPSGTR